MTLARRAGTALLRTAAVNRAVRGLARLRGHQLVLVYHRLGPPVQSGCEIVPSVPVDVFRAQLQALAEVVELVTLDEILAKSGLSAPARPRPAVALTFDDDLPSHVEHALPALRDSGVPAAFFLSGRALNGRGAYWFQHLEALLIARGSQRTAALLGLNEDGTDALMIACEQRIDLRRRVTELAVDLSAPEILDRNGIAALAGAGMTIGFHTVNHDVLPGLSDAALADAVSFGLTDVVAAGSTTVRYFAYPHGKADPRSAVAVRNAGFHAAFTGRAAPVRRGDDRYRLGRWEPGPLAVDDLLLKLALRLNRAAPERGFR